MSRLALLVSLLLGGTLLFAVGAGSRPLEVNPAAIQILEPANGAVHTAGTPIVFRVRTDVADTYFMRVSSSPNPVDDCGQIDDDVHLYSLDPTAEDASVYSVQPPNYTFEGYWLVTPATYYWQAYRYDADASGGCVASEVRTLIVKRGSGTTTTTARTTTTKTTTTKTTTTKTTPPPPPKKALPLAMARLQGDFNVRYRLTAVHNFNEDVGTRGDFSWSFKPNCGRGPCSARINLDGDGAFKMNRGGASYNGSGKARLTSCLMSSVWGTSSIRLTVKQGMWREGRWLAKRWTGTLSHSWGSTGSCASGSFSAVITGALDLG